MPDINQPGPEGVTRRVSADSSPEGAIQATGTGKNLRHLEAPRGADGQAQGGTTFQDQWGET